MSKKSRNNIIMPTNHKIFNDSVHGHMKMHPLCVEIIDTPQFQRLRNIKQVSTTYLVYPGASHNRFEHSLGVSYLGGCMVDALVHNTQNLIITPEEKLSVEVAGLCHDLGHGPFSHTWERYLKMFENQGHVWHHETASEEVLDWLITDNNLQSSFDRYHLDITLIKELIRGEGNSLSDDKKFLYQIIANKINDIDVDKWDYFLRDGHQLNLKITFDYRRLLSFCVVMWAPIPASGLNKGTSKGTQNGTTKVTMIAYRNKEAANIFDMFRVRADLHFRAYQHTAVKNTELMLLDGLKAANDYYVVEADGRRFTLSEAHTNVRAFLKLSDHILHSIMYSDDPRMEEAQAILKRLNKRQLYTVIGEFRFCMGQEQVRLTQNALQTKFPKVEFALSLRIINFGSTGNPLKRIIFYKKPNEEGDIVIDDSGHENLYRSFPFDISRDASQKDLIVFAKSTVTDVAKNEIREYTEEYLNLMGYQ